MTREEKLEDLTTRIRNLERCIQAFKVIPNQFRLLPRYTLSRLAELDQEHAELRYEL